MQVLSRRAARNVRALLARRPKLINELGRRGPRRLHLTFGAASISPASASALLCDCLLKRPFFSINSSSASSARPTFRSRPPAPLALSRRADSLERPDGRATFTHRSRAQIGIPAGGRPRERNIMRSHRHGPARRRSSAGANDRLVRPKNNSFASLNVAPGSPSAGHLSATCRPSCRRARLRWALPLAANERAGAT